MSLFQTNLLPTNFRKAELDDVPVIVSLINSAYRGESSKAGWTTEADLLDGVRTTDKEIGALIDAEDSMILLCIVENEIVGTVHLQNERDFAYIGMFVVKPVLQGSGIGKLFLAAAEHLVHNEWGVSRANMTVISLRKELIAYYERRGYRQTGEMRPFPDDTVDSVSKVGTLQFVVMEKELV